MAQQVAGHIHAVYSPVEQCRIEFPLEYGELSVLDHFPFQNMLADFL
jgi:hypothetical protein